MISPRERVYKAVAHEETDIVPYNIPTHPRAHRKLVKLYGEAYHSNIVNHFATVWPLVRLFPTQAECADLSTLAHTLDSANFPLEFINEYVAVQGKPWVDEFECVWCQSLDGAPQIVKHAPSKPGLRKHQFPDLYKGPIS